ncbi:MAG: hypothetical protein ABIN96_01755 [Rubrivivax sp.]
MTARLSPPALRSFWMAGFEGADHRNCEGLALDMVGTTGHAERLDEDYQALAVRGVRVVRESLGWRLCEPQGGGRFDFDRAHRMAQSAQRHGLQVLWTLMHYGVPPDVSLLDDGFCERFTAFAVAAAKAVAPYTAAREAPVFTPINEISFLAWAACETNLIHPHVGDRSDPRHVPLPDGYEVKRRLARATLQAITAIRQPLPEARFLHVDPLVHVVAPHGAEPALAAEAARFREFQWQAWDMLSGRLEPALGGNVDALDLVGVNHYPTAQWEFATGAELTWKVDGTVDPRRMPLSALLSEAWQRYQRPIVVAETGHCEGARAAWLRWVAQEAQAAQAGGVDLRGVCLYPVIARPDWNDPSDWHRCGLWDATPDEAAAAAANATPITKGTPRHPLTGSATPSPGRHLVADLDAALAACRTSTEALS